MSSISAIGSATLLHFAKPAVSVAGDRGAVNSLEEFVNDYAALRHHYVLPIALWAMGTYCWEKFDAFGYLTFTSTAPGAGKTRMLEVLECLCCRAARRQESRSPGCALSSRETGRPFSSIRQSAFPRTTTTT